MHYALFNDYDDCGRLKPVTTDRPFEVIQVACGYNFQVFLQNDGQVFSAGSNKYGQLGTEPDPVDKEGDEEEKDTPGAGDTPMDKEEEDVSAFVTKDMKQKAADLKKRADQYEPKLICQELMASKRVASVAAGGMHVVAIVDGGSQVFAWGKNTDGQLGTGGNEPFRFGPTMVKNVGREHAVKQAACGDAHSVFLTAAGLVWTCGSNQFGQRGVTNDAVFMEGDDAMVGNNLGSVPSQIEKGVLDNVIMIAAGRFHTAAIRRQNAGDSVKFEEEDEEASDSMDSEEKEIAMGNER